MNAKYGCGCRKVYGAGTEHTRREMSYQPCIAVVRHIEAKISHLRAIARTLRKMKAS
jgi:hypothetical protein